MMLRRRRRFRNGDIVKCPTGPDGTDEWFVIDYDQNANYAAGPCLISLYLGERVGKIFGLTNNEVERVSPSKVPQYVLVALAKFRLTQ